jgi:hypothetical protein
MSTTLPFLLSLEAVARETIEGMVVAGKKPSPPTVFAWRDNVQIGAMLARNMPDRPDRLAWLDEAQRFLAAVRADGCIFAADAWSADGSELVFTICMVPGSSLMRQRPYVRAGRKIAWMPVASGPAREAMGVLDRFEEAISGRVFIGGEPAAVLDQLRELGNDIELGDPYHIRVIDPTRN